MNRTKHELSEAFKRTALTYINPLRHGLFIIGNVYAQSMISRSLS